MNTTTNTAGGGTHEKDPTQRKEDNNAMTGEEDEDDDDDGVCPNLGSTNQNLTSTTIEGSLAKHDDDDLTSSISGVISASAAPEAKMVKKRTNEGNTTIEGNLKQHRLLLMKDASSKTIVIKSILDLPDELLSTIFEFVGPGQFLYIAGTCKNFAAIYKNVHIIFRYGIGFRRTVFTSIFKSQEAESREVLKKIFGSGGPAEVSGIEPSWRKVISEYLERKDTKINKNMIPHRHTSYKNAVESISRIQHWFKEVSDEGQTKKHLMKFAIRAGKWGSNLHVLDYIMDQQPTDVSFNISLWEEQQLVNDVQKEACAAGRIDVLKHSVQKSTVEWTKEPLANAVVFKRIDIIKWLLKETNCPRHTSLCSLAVHLGDVATIKCLLDCGCTLHNYAMWQAAHNGHLEMIKYLRLELSHSWDDRACEGAAKHGHLHCLQWMVENGCPWDRSTCRAQALNREKMDVVRWIDENRNID